MAHVIREDLKADQRILSAAGGPIAEIECMALLTVMAIDDQHGKVDWLKPSSACTHAYSRTYFELLR
jgi:hypothetical protein